MDTEIAESEYACPDCGLDLVVKNGKYGEFLACPNFPGCRYTKSIKTGVVYKQDIKPKVYCQKCNHTGLIPFRNKNGELVYGAFLDCECKKQQESEDHYFPVHPKDFDFPISYSFHRSLCQYHGWQDPGSCEPPVPEKQEVVHQHYHLDKNALKLNYRLVQVEGLSKLTERELKEHLNKGGKPVKKEYHGIEL